MGISFNFGIKILEITEPKTARLPSSPGCTEKAPSIYFEKWSYRKITAIKYIRAGS
jgi:hypothetical protein